MKLKYDTKEYYLYQINVIKLADNLIKDKISDKLTDSEIDIDDYMLHAAVLDWIDERLKLAEDDYRLFVQSKLNDVKHD